MANESEQKAYFQGNIRVADESDAQPQAESQFETAMTEIVPILELSGDMFDQLSPQLLSHRLKLLQNRCEQLVGSSGDVRDFILATTHISPSKESGSYRIDDDSIYTEVFATARNLYRDFIERGATTEAAFFSAAIHTAQIEQTRYFEGLPTQDRAAERSRLLARTTGNFKPMSIGELKSAPMCSERAAVAHNVLHLCGIPSVFHTGLVGRIADGSSVIEDQSRHAFLTVKNAEGKEKIYDPANPIKYRNNGGVVRETPSLYTVPENDRDVVVVNKPSYVKQADGSYKQDKTVKLAYGFKK